jgi:hypothetical protein
VEELYSDQLEADTLLFLHAAHAKKDVGEVTIISEDTDVFVLALGHCSQLAPCKMNVQFKHGKKVICLQVNQLREALGARIAETLIGFHCLTGCDSVSAFHGKGKVKPMEILLKSTNEIRQAMKSLGDSWSLSKATIKNLETFVCRIYGHTKIDDINEARFKDFCAKTLDEKRLPPTKDSLHLHFQRANYQARIYKLALLGITDLPEPSKHGWTIVDSQLEILWTTMPPAPEKLIKILKCSCKASKCATNQCSCRAAGVSCDLTCTCNDCDNVIETLDERNLLMDDSSDDSSDEDY